MVPLSDVQASNSKANASLPSGFVAVFAGAKAGIGEMALKAFATYTIQPRIYFIGRSQDAGERLRSELKDVNSGAECIFIEVDMSLLKNVDEVCRDIKAKEKSIGGVLFMSQGSMRTGVDTEEGIPYITALTYYSRTRLTLDPLPLLRCSTSLRRVITVMAGGEEGRLYADDVAGRKVPLQWPSQEQLTPHVPLTQVRSSTQSCTTLQGAPIHGFEFRSVAYLVGGEGLVLPWQCSAQEHSWESSPESTSPELSPQIRWMSILVLLLLHLNSLDRFVPSLANGRSERVGMSILRILDRLRPISQGQISMLSYPSYVRSRDGERKFSEPRPDNFGSNKQTNK